MTQPTATLYQLLAQTARTEQAVVAVWREARAMIAQGQASPAQFAVVDALADKLYAIQRHLTDPVFGWIDRAPARVQSEINEVLRSHGWSLHLSRLPALSAQPQGLRGGAGLGVVTGGLAEIPVGVLVCGTIVAIAAIIALLAFFLYESEYVGGLVLDVQTLRGDAQDAQRRLQAQQSRYQDCLRGGGTPQTCAADFPLPQPTDFFRTRQETRPDPTPPWLVGLASIGGLVALSALVYVGAKGYGFASPTKRIVEALP